METFMRHLTYLPVPHVRSFIGVFNPQFASYIMPFFSVTSIRTQMYYGQIFTKCDNVSVPANQSNNAHNTHCEMHFGPLSSTLQIQLIVQFFLAILSAIGVAWRIPELYPLYMLYEFINTFSMTFIQMDHIRKRHQNSMIDLVVIYYLLIVMFNDFRNLVAARRSLPMLGNNDIPVHEIQPVENLSTSRARRPRNERRRHRR